MGVNSWEESPLSPLVVPMIKGSRKKKNKWPGHDALLPPPPLDLKGRLNYFKLKKRMKKVIFPYWPVLNPLNGPAIKIAASQR